MLYYEKKNKKHNSTIGIVYYTEDEIILFTHKYPIIVTVNLQTHLNNLVDRYIKNIA